MSVLFLAERLTNAEIRSVKLLDYFQTELTFCVRQIFYMFSIEYKSEIIGRW